MKKIFLWVLLLSAVNLSAQKLSSSTVVSLITVNPGDQLYNAFGHSAILIEDSIANVSSMYNYGTFDFEDPNFYSNFTRGKLKYMLAIEEPMSLYYNAKFEKRGIVQQVLNLSWAQKQRLFDLLQENAKPENCAYKYDFFYDNCSSRLRDVLMKACGDSLIWELPKSNDKSFRALIDPYLNNQRYQDMGMDLGMGTPADVVATPAQMMFLPDYLKNFVSKAKRKEGSTLIPLVSKERNVLNYPPFPEDPFWKKPGVAMGGILFITLAMTLFQFRRKRAGHWFDVALFTIGGLVSLLLIFLWFFTDHGVTKWNLHLLWANPILFVFIYFILKKSTGNRASGLVLTYFFATVFLLLFWTQWTQDLNGYLAPLVLSLSVRALYVFYRMYKKTEVNA